MNRVLPFLLGPELYWIVVCGVTSWISRRGIAPDPAVTAQLDRFWVVLPLVVVPLTFACFVVPGSGRWWLLLRVDLAIAIGLAVATTRYCESMTYHQPSAGPGAGTAWMVMLGLGYGFAVVGTLVAAVVIWWKGRGS